jgi:hypothetical protein
LDKKLGNVSADILSAESIGTADDNDDANCDDDAYEDVNSTESSDDLRIEVRVSGTGATTVGLGPVDTEIVPADTNIVSCRSDCIV